MELPLFELVIADNDEGTAEVNCISFVKRPAIEKNFLAFSSNEENNKQKFSILSDEKKIVAGAVMLADVPIYRKDNERGEYYVVFNKDTIETIAQRFFKRGYQSNVNTNHSDKVDGVTFYQSFIYNKELGIQPMKGFEDVPEGSWFVVAKVDNEDLWNQVKSEEFKGFSVEGIFGMKELSMQEELNTDEIILNEIINILKEVK